ncbi:1,4-dihydroxy-2-naphthoate octaprenyltransferase [Pseudobutyrivibrio sp. ACV-2]|uniref:UbiA family prenyltransferase n=1 Tax=Pseudobutyrivibrio sp. ACV-2 TaxID=1520801 RepID=UPI00089A11B9|nr:UbiA family prenyltransferase [Pseudobutyrivibrio sp. ACV-2]SEA64200.1 1,4-dihydroxy-2-naphthoate octaprenyltransferase [Pseudobutyrivibrio sp. ACV-2]
MVGRFLKFVEIQTKITSLYAFCNTLAFIIFTRQPINAPLMIVFFLSMFIFDLTTTGINNYIDSKDYPEMLPIPRSKAFVAIISMLCISTILGLYLAYKTGIVVLLLGAFCFMLGIFYTFGPIPISRIPLGELFSGIAYGMFIPFLMLYINNPDYYLTLTLSLKTISLSLQVVPLISFFLFSLVMTFTTANIMLANNTCDLKKDEAVHRLTLVHYIGQKAAVKLFAGLYYGCYISVVLMVIFRMLSPLSLVFLLSLIPVQKNINTFKKEQIKEKTFICSIKNYVIINSAYFVSILIGLLY